MSRNLDFDAVHDSSFRRRDRRRSSRSQVLTSFARPRTSPGAAGWALVERLEERTLLSIAQPFDIGARALFDATSTLTVPVKTGLSVPANDTVFVMVAIDPVAGAVTISDTAGSIAFRASADLDYTAGTRLLIFSGTTTTAFGDTDTITVNLPAGVRAKAATVLGAAGVLTSSSPLDLSSTASGTGTSAAVTAPSNVPVGELALGAIAAAAQTTIVPDLTPTHPLNGVLTGAETSGANATDVSLLPEFRVADTASAFTGAATLSPAAAWTAALVTYAAQPPTAVDHTYPSYENLPLTVAAPGLLQGAQAFGNGTLVPVIDLQPANGNVVLHQTGGVPDGGFTYTPNPNYFSPTGSPDTFKYHVVDGTLASSPVSTVSVNVQWVNQPPTLDQPAPLSVFENAAATTINLTGITPGPANEWSTQTLSLISYTVISDPSGVVGSVSINPTSLTSPYPAQSTLTFTPATNTFGTATIRIFVKDDADTANGGHDTFTRDLAVTVVHVNQPPTLDQPAPLSVLENAAPTTINLTGITPGPANESTDKIQLSYTVISDPYGVVGSVSINPSSLTSPYPTQSTLTFTPTTNAFGTATIRITAQDDGGTANGGHDTVTRDLAVTVVHVNQPPTLDQPPAFSVAENALATTLTLTGITPGPMNEWSGIQIPAETITNFSYSVISDPSGVVGSVSFSPTTLSGPFPATTSLVFTPATNTFGTATIRIFVQDDGGKANGGVDTFSRDVSVTVNPINQPPVFDKLPSNPQNLPASGTLVFSAANVPSNAIHVTDVDGSGETPTATVSVLAGALTVTNTAGLTVTNNGTGTVTFKGTYAAINSGFEGLTYTANAGTTGDTLSIRVDDRLGQPDNQFATASIVIGVNVADLSVSMVQAPSQGANFLVGLVSAYTITVKNYGPSPATNLVVTDKFSGPTTDLVFQPTTASIGGTPLTSGQYTATQGGSSAQVHLNVPLPAGSTATFVVTVTPGTAGQLTSTVTTAHPELDDDTPAHPNGASSTVTVNDAGLVGFDQPSGSGPNNDTPTVTFSHPTYNDYSVVVDRTLTGTTTAFGTVGFNVSILTTGTANARIGTYQGKDVPLPAENAITQYEIWVPSSDGTQRYSQEITSNASPFQLYFAPGVTSQTITIRVWRSPYITSDAHVRLEISKLSPTTPVDPNNGARLDTTKADMDFTITNANSFVVTTSADSGAGSLRDIVALAGLSAPPSGRTTNPITFARGVTEVDLLSTVMITSPVTIDGTTVTNDGRSTFVVIQPNTKGTVGTGLTIASAGSSSILTNLTVQGFTSEGILVQASNTQFTNDTITGNGVGVHIANAPNNTVGSLTSPGGNKSSDYIYGNTTAGVLIDGSASTGNLVAYCSIGLDATGNPAGGSSTQPTGIVVSGIARSSIFLENNVISGNSGDGVSLAAASGVTLWSNKIGTSAQGSLLTGVVNNAIGVHLVDAPSNTIGASGHAPNVISGNSSAGILATGASGDNTIQYNYIGLDASGLGAVPNGALPVVQLVSWGDGSLVPTSGKNLVVLGTDTGGKLQIRMFDAAGARTDVSEAQLSKLQAGEVALLKQQLTLLMPPHTLTDVERVPVLNDVSGLAGLALPAGIVVKGVVSDAAGFQIVSNVVSGNDGDGILLEGGTNQVQLTGNTIGLVASGTSAQGNAGSGIHVLDSTAITIGPGTAGTSRNVISGNEGDGILIASVASPGATGSVVVQNNIVGLDGNGGGALANAMSGVQVSGVVSTAGSPLTILNNVVSGNTGDGILLNAGTSRVLITGNKVGLNAAGTGPVANTHNGIHLVNATQVQVGPASDSTDRNVISGNTLSGVKVESIPAATTGSDGNVIAFNWIGIDAGGSLPLGNREDGVQLDGTPGTLVNENLIAANAGNGINASNAYKPVITLNLIGTGAVKHTESLGNTKSGVLISKTAGAMIGGPGVANTILNNNVGVTVDGDPSASVPSGAQIFNNYIGTDATFHTGLGNTLEGIWVNNAKGVTVQANVIAGNLGDGIVAQDTTGLAINGNGIGTSTDGITVLGNRGNGIVIADIDPAGNASGLTTTKVTIGTSAPNFIENNALDGVKLSGVAAPARPVPSVTIQGNTITGNGTSGIEVVNSSGVRGAPEAEYSFQILGNNIGTAAAPNGLDGVRIDASSSVRVYAKNVISGNNVNGVELTNGATWNVIGAARSDATQPLLSNGNTIAQNGGDGVRIFTSVTATSEEITAVNLIQYNLIGNAPGVTGDSANVGNGVAIVGPSINNTVFTNVIAGNHNSGVLISDGGLGNALFGNTIGGVPPTIGTNFQANRNNGISILNAGSGNTLGSNTIEGNTNNGVLISSTDGTFVNGNYIGTDSSGTIGLGNSNIGLFLLKATNTIATGNTIGSNRSHAVAIVDDGNENGNNRIDWNFLGVTQSGTQVANSLSGVLLLNAMGNFVDDNTIAGNQSHGVFIVQGTAGTKSNGITVVGNIVSGNAIGLWYDKDANTFHALGNIGDGVLIVNSSGNIIGSSSAGTAVSNTIGDNTLSGVEIQGEPGANTVASNVIFANSAHGVFVNSSPGNIIQGNNIGQTGGGMAAGNTLDGISLNRATGTRVDGNKVANNQVDGIGLLASPPTNTPDAVNTISNNSIWANGIPNQPSTGDGIRIEETSSGNLIGTAGANDIYGNLVAGIEIRTGSTANVVVNNRIGIDTTGAANANGIGVYLNNVSGNRIGVNADGTAAGNTISGNQNYGIEVAGNSPDTRVSNKGNFIEYNQLGTNPQGFALPSTSAPRQNVGLYVLNSTSNQITGNLASGNATAGIELFGALSTNNILVQNKVGSDKKQNNLNTGAGANAYLGGSVDDPTQADPNRQKYGIWLNNAPNNTVGVKGDAKLNSANTVLGNDVGIRVDGAGASGNNIYWNSIGPVNGTNVDGLGNFFGVEVLNTTNTLVVGNQVQHNVSVGIGIVGPASQSNFIQSNTVTSNGGYATNANYRDETSPYVLVPYSYALANYKQTIYLFGTGIYVESGQFNVIGSTPSSAKLEDKSQGNTVTDNTEVGIYLFNGALNDSVRSNTVYGVNHPGGPWNGDYCILLYNSASDVFNVQLTGKFTNKIQGARIANFREYTGPVSLAPPTFTPTVTSGVKKPGRKG